MEKFNDYNYTRDSILKQLVLMELHGKDGSAVDAGCQCINTKHTYILEGLCEEMAGFAKNEAEAKWYLDFSALMRQARQQIDQENWRPLKASGSCQYSDISVKACADKLAKCLESNPYSVCKQKVRCLS